MIQMLLRRPMLPLLALLALGGVALDHRDRRQPAGGVADRRGGVGDEDPPPVLGQPLGLDHALLRRRTLQPVELSPAELAVALRRGELDMALLGPVNDALRREFATRLLGAMPAMLAMGAGNPLAKRRVHALADLRAAEWVVWDERSFPGRGALLHEAAAAAGFKPRVVHTVDSLASMFMHATTSHAVGYVLPISKKFPHSGVVFAALKPPAIVFEMNVAWRRTAAASECLPELAELLATTPPAI